MIVLGSWPFSGDDLTLGNIVNLCAYAAAATLSLYAGRNLPLNHTQASQRFWNVGAAVLVVVGVIKELDLHVLLVEAIRRLPTPWRGNEPQLLAMVVLSIAVMACVRWRGRLRCLSREALEAFGVFVALMMVIFLRFSPIGPVSRLLSVHLFGTDQGLWHVHLVELFELSLVLLIMCLAWRQVRSGRAHAGSSPAGAE